MIIVQSIHRLQLLGQQLHSIDKMWRLVNPRKIASSIRRFSSAKSQLMVGDELHGYRVNRVELIEEISATAIELHHESSGSQHLHVAREDDNNFFSVTLRTTPKDDTGVPHILEHLALCGSERFPCRDPFMKMTSRSLATFLNAMTWPDATMYPFSSTNEKDFSNLMEVYLDAVFYPKLRHLDFLQEGWRLEYKDVKDKSSEIVFKGVVFNEMKGAFSSPSQLYYRCLLNELFPNTTYQYESGGDPLAIPSLTYENLISFYKEHYHPSNAKFFTYGSFPLEKHLDRINSRVLSKFPKNVQFREVSKVHLQEPWSSPKKKVIECAPDPLAPFPDKQTTASVSFLMEDIVNSSECFVLSLLSFLLTSGPNSPFYQALISKGLGSDYSPGTGLSDFTRQTFFSIGCSGMKDEDSCKLEDIVLETLQEATQNGFPNERIEAVIHLIEIGLKHMTANTGMHIAMNSNAMLNHDADVITAIKTNQEIKKLRQNLANDPDFLKKKMQQYFLENKHRLFLEMKPSKDFMSKNQEKEKSLLKSKVSGLTDDDKERIYKTGLELSEFQSKEEDASVLPTLNVAKDISRERKFYKIVDNSVNGVPVQSCPGKTNGVTYFKALFVMDNLPSHLQPYLPLFSSIITKIGAGKRTFKQMDQEITMRTKGLKSSVHNVLHPSSLTNCERGILVSSYCLNKNAEAMLNLWKDVILTPNFTEDLDHVSQLIRMMAADMTDGVAHSGNTYANMIASQNLTPTAQFREQTSGLTFMKFLKETVEANQVHDIIQKLQEIQELVFSKKGLRLSLNSEVHDLESNLKLLENVVAEIDNEPSADEAPLEQSNSDEVKEHHFLNLNTNFVAKAVTGVPFSHEDNAALTIAGSLLSKKYLLREVREVGGAYGVRASNGEAVFSFTSYRDPQTTDTLKKFEDSVSWLIQASFTEEDINEAKLSVFQSLDAPITPESKGNNRFLRKVSQEERHQYRLRLLDVNRQDLIRVAEKHLLNRTGEGTGCAIIGPETKNTAPDFKVVTH